MIQPDQPYKNAVAAASVLALSLVTGALISIMLWLHVVDQRTVAAEAVLAESRARMARPNPVTVEWIGSFPALTYVGGSFVPVRLKK